MNGLGWTRDGWGVLLLPFRQNDTAGWRGAAARRGDVSASGLARDKRVPRCDSILLYIMNIFATITPSLCLRSRIITAGLISLFFACLTGALPAAAICAFASYSTLLATRRRFSILLFRMDRRYAGPYRRCYFLPATHHCALSWAFEHRREDTTVFTLSAVRPSTRLPATYFRCWKTHCTLLPLARAYCLERLRLLRGASAALAPGACAHKAAGVISRGVLRCHLQPGVTRLGETTARQA